MSSYYPVLARPCRSPPSFSLSSHQSFLHFWLRTLLTHTFSHLASPSAPQIELGSIEFRNPEVERASALTAADRKWMDEIVLDVNATWDEEDPTRPTSMQ